MWRLVEAADIVVDGNRHRVMERLGFGHVDMRTRVPRLVYIQHTGFGAGPYDAPHR
jgi:crotonobetainyl-CoA:carnitine CoA-transferase CaiB-like acyl-CoA transferase